MDSVAPAPVPAWARRAFQIGCLPTVLVTAATHARAVDLASSTGGLGAPPSVLTLAAILAGFGVAVMAWRQFGHGAAATGALPALTARPDASPAASLSKPLAATMQPGIWSRMPDLDPIPYDGEMQKYVARQPAPAPRSAPSGPVVTPAKPAAAPAQSGNAPAQPAVAPAPGTHALSDATRQRILERYIGARFTGVAARSEDFLDAPRIVKAARLLFEDGQIERAVELLLLATEVNPANEAPWLAMLEILFLGANAAAYARAARRFAITHAGSQSWPQIRQLGRKLGLDDAVISKGMAHHERFPNYGPWGGLPNWIQAPWDLTGDAALAELHARLKDEAALAAEATQRRVA